MAAVASTSMSAGNVVRAKIIRPSFNYWYPGTDYLASLVIKLKRIINDGDILVLSEKALSVALGNIYDESSIPSDPLTSLLAKAVNDILWLRCLRKLFKDPRTPLMLSRLPKEALVKHKKLALKVGGLKHFLKPLSECGIDTSNLPYSYVSLPLSKANEEARRIREGILKETGKLVNVLIIDTDRAFLLNGLRCIAIATRPSWVRGVVDLGFIGYILGRALGLKPYPTPVAYEGTWLGLPRIMKLAKVAERAMGHGLGRNLWEMVQRLGRRSYAEVTWIDMRSSKHHPVVLVRVSRRKI